MEVLVSLGKRIDISGSRYSIDEMLRRLFNVWVWPSPTFAHGIASRFKGGNLRRPVAQASDVGFEQDRFRLVVEAHVAPTGVLLAIQVGGRDQRRMEQVELEVYTERLYEQQLRN